MRREYLCIEIAAYAADLAAVASAMVLLELFGKSGYVTAIFSSTALGWSAFFGGLLALAFGAWLSLFQLNTDEFGTWLEWKGVGASISRAFLFHAATFLVGAAVMLLSSVSHREVLGRIQLSMVLLAAINTLTLGLLIYQVLRLQSVFRLEWRKHGDGSP